MRFAPDGSVDDSRDPLFEEAARLVIEGDNASASFLQRKLLLGYARCARILDELQMAGIVGPADGARPRDVLVRSYEDFLKAQGIGAEELQSEYDGYRVPDFKLTPPDPIPWGTSLADATYDALTLPLGIDEAGQPVHVRLDELGHLLIAGSPQSRKMQAVDLLLVSQLAKTTPAQLNLILADESRHLSVYRHLPHVISSETTDVQGALSALQWLRREFIRRQDLFQRSGVRNLDTYLTAAGALPRIMMVIRLINWNRELDEACSVLTSYGHVAGLHLILVVDQASQVFVSTQLKSNIPNRLVFRTTTSRDSTLAGVTGAHLLGDGQAVLKLSPFPDRRITTYYCSEQNVSEVIDTVRGLVPDKPAE